MLWPPMLLPSARLFKELHSYANTHLLAPDHSLSTQEQTKVHPGDWVFLKALLHQTQPLQLGWIGPFQVLLTVPTR